MENGIHNNMAILTDDDIAKFDYKQSPQGNAPKVLTDDDIAKFDSSPRDDKSQSPKEMMKGAFDSAQGMVDFAGTDLSKTFTGKGLGDRAREATAPNIPPATQRPFDSNVQQAGNPINQALQIGKQAAAGTVGDIAGGFLSPIGLVAGAEGAVGAKLRGAAEGAKQGIAKAALSPEFAQTKADFAYGHDARRVMATMPDVIGEDLPSTQAAIKAKSQETGKAIEDTINNSEGANTKIDIESDVTKPFDDKILELRQQGVNVNKNAIVRLQQAKNDLLNKFDEEGNVTGVHSLNEMTPAEIWDYRKTKIDPMTKFTGNPSDDAAVNSAYQEARSNLRQRMNDAIPELKPLNRDYGDLTAADDAVERLSFKQQKNGLSELGIKQIITAGLNNPLNRAKLAQWLYSAPQKEINSMAEAVPELGSVVEDLFGPEGVSKLGMAGQAGSKGAESVGGEVKPAIGGGNPPQKGLVVANIGADGKIYYGKPGELHFNLSEQHSNNIRKGLKSGDPTWKEVGFAGPDGKFLTREEALKNSGIKSKENYLDAKEYQIKSGTNIGNNKGQSFIGGNKNDPTQKLMRDNTAQGYRSVRKTLQEGASAAGDVAKSPIGAAAALGTGLAVGLGATNAHGMAKRPINNEDAIKTIIGEGESTGFQGMRALASAIRNRGTLQGAYGLKSPRVVNKLYSAKTERLARQAWEDSKKKDFSDGANHWFSDADLKQPRVQAMTKSMKKLGSYRGNNFYQEKGKAK